MATKKKPTGGTASKKGEATRAREASFSVPELPLSEGTGFENGVETTGRFIVVFKEGAAGSASAVRSALKDAAGLREVVSSADYDTGAVTAEDMDEKEVVHFEQLGIALVSGSEAVQSLAAAAADADSSIEVIEPEYVAQLSSAQPAGLDLSYLRGYRDAVNHLFDQISVGQGAAEGAAELLAAFQDTEQFTWGLQATGVSTSRFNGQGINVAVLDTGLDLQHPDFTGRAIITETFSGLPVQDIHGHGTHCVGTACGALRPATGVRRYGVATAAQIFVGKVFNNNPKPGADTGHVIAGIEWAIKNGCRVVSMSLGVPINQQLAQYSTPIRRALKAGTLVICAAGNNANRPSNPGFVEPPANADDSMAVAAVDSQLQIARFSARSSQVAGDGGKVNIAAPGVAVFSSVPVARGTHALFNGTSMATPHVAGIAALWAQAEGLSGIELWSRLLKAARPLSLPSVDVGAGLVQAPQ